MTSGEFRRNHTVLAPMLLDNDAAEWFGRKDCQATRIAFMLLVRQIPRGGRDFWGRICLRFWLATAELMSSSQTVQCSRYQTLLKIPLGLQALQDLKPGLKEFIPLLQTNDPAARAPLIIRAAELSLPLTKAYSATREFYDLPPNLKR